MNTCYQYEQGYERTQYEDSGLNFRDGRQVKAKYIRSFDMTDNGNRLIEALPPARKEEECVNDFVKIPYWTPEVRKKSVRERVSLCSHLSDFKIPRDFTLDVDFSIRDMMVRCYRAKIPNACPGSNGPGFYNTSGEVISGGLLIGNSGAGKTTAILHALDYYPQLIVHEMPDSRMLQIPYLNVLCPPDASVKGFYDLCLNEIERITGETINERYKRGTADLKGQIFRRQALRFNIGLIVVDEVQNIMNVQKKTLMQHFLNLTNELGVPFLFVGTDKVKLFFENEEFYIKRRTGVLMEANVFEKNEVWESFFRKLWQFQWMQDVVPYSQNFSDVFFKESAGNIDRVKELYIVSQKEAIKMGLDTVENFTPSYIEEVSQKYFKISYKELNQKAETPQAIERLLPEGKTFHSKDNIKKIILHGCSIGEKKEVLKYKVVETVGEFSNGKYSVKQIEKAFDTIANDIDVLRMEESIVCMEVLKNLMQESNPSGVVRREKRERKSVEEMFKELPVMESVVV